MIRTLTLVLLFGAVVATNACGILGLSIACDGDANCPAGVCVDGQCRTDVQGEGEGTLGEGEGEGASSEGEGEGASSEGEGEGASSEGEGEGASSEGEGEGASGEGEGEGEGEGGPPNDCTDTVFVPPGIAPEFVVAHGAASTGGRCFGTLTDAMAALAGQTTTSTRTVYVAPGRYDESAGETFPLEIPTEVTLVGDVAQQGTTTIISPVAPAGLNADFLHADVNAIVEMDGIQIGDDGENSSRAFDANFASSVTIEHCTFKGNDTLLRAVTFSGVLTIESTDFFGGPAADVFFNLAGAGEIDVAQSNFRRIAVDIFGASTKTPFAVTFDNDTMLLDFNSGIRVDTQSNVLVSNSAFGNNAGATGCQHAISVESGHTVVRQTSFTALACDALNHRGAIDVDPNAGDPLPTLDLGAFGDSGQNTFLNNALDLAVHYSTTSADFTATTEGTTWSDDLNPCNRMRLENASGHSVTIELNSSGTSTCHAP